MNMFFVYQGDLPTNLYIDRLSRLTGAQIVAAFPTRQEAVDFATGIDGGKQSRVVAERTFSMQNGDDNNLISECEWNRGAEIKPPPKPELTGGVEITGQAITGEDLSIKLIGINAAGPFNFQWYWVYESSGGGLPGFEEIPHATNDFYVITNIDLNRKIAVIVTKEGYEGELKSQTVGPIQEPAPLPDLTGSVRIDGNLQVGETLTADISLLDGTGAISYHWARADSSTATVNDLELINGANDPTYLLDGDDENMFIFLTVSRSGNTGIILSEGVGPVVGV